MTLHDLLHAALYSFVAVASITALAVALFGSTAVIERWLDGPGIEPISRTRLTVIADSSTTVAESAARTPAA